MNQEKQRIAIAEACGWKDIKDTNHEDVNIESRSISCWSGLTGVPPKFIHYEWNRVIIPDYLNDLNAMHEAEQSLWLKDWNLRYVFCDHLADAIRGRRVNRNEWGPELMLDALAAQRAEAFLKTIGKWEDDK